MNPRDDRADRERRFDEELGRVARALVTEELPRGVLDDRVSTSLGLGRVIDGSISTRRPLPGLATAAATAIVLLVATVVVFGPQLPGGPGPSATPAPPVTAGPTAAPVFRTSAEIRADFEALEYGCVVGEAVDPAGTGPDVVTRESVVCTPPTDGKPYMAAVIVGESAAGRVVEAHAKADLVGGDTPASRTELATLLGKAAAVVVVEGSGTGVGTWVESNLPGLEPGASLVTSVAGVTLEMARSATGSYTLRLTPSGTGG